MGSNTCFSFFFFFFSSLLLFNFASASPFLSDDIFDSGSPISRSLLQTKKGCPVNFETQNYTILTSQCKGPIFPPNVCCNAFKQFACPFVDDINDLNTDCASSMFSYIIILGKYPPGLFAYECREGKKGLDCASINAPPPSSSTNHAYHTSPSHSLLLMSSAFMAFIFFFFHLA